MKITFMAFVTALFSLPSLSSAAIINQFYALTSNSYYSYSAYDYGTDEIVTDTTNLTGFLLATINDANNTVTLDYSNVLMGGSAFRATETLNTDGIGIASGTLTSGFTGEFDYISYGNATLSPFPSICVECGYEMILNLDAYTTSNPLALSYYEYNPYDTGEAHFELFISQVPLPGAAWLFGSGLLGLFGVCRSKVTLQGARSDANYGTLRLRRTAQR